MYSTLCFVLSYIQCSNLFALDLYQFEENIVPKIVNQYAIDIDKGIFKFTPSSTDITPSVYGTTDLIHMLHFIGQTSNYIPNSTIQSAWINQVYSFQNTTGFYNLEPSESKCGFQPWHSTAFITSALSLLNNATPKYNNSYYANIAENTNLWNITFDPLIHYEEGREQGCDSIHACAHKIVGIPATIVGEQNRMKYQSFINWWFDGFIYPNLDPHTGTLCPTDQEILMGKSVCLGAGAAVHMFDTFTATQWPFAMDTFKFARSLQNGYYNKSSECPGLFEPNCKLTTWSNFDGIYQMTRSSKQMNYYEWNNTVRTSCEMLLNYTVPLLNNETFVIKELSDDTHIMPGIVAGVAECVMQFPSLITTKYNWTCCAPFP